MFLETIVMTCFKQIHGQRSDSSLYHLLTGKKSIQTIQDAHIYQLQNYYGICKRMSKQQLNEKIQLLYRAGLLHSVSSKESIPLVNKRGDAWLRTYRKKYPVHYFRGMEYNGIADVFYQRFILFIQTLTNSHNNHFSFIPVIDQPSVETWMKNVYRKAKGKEAEILHSLYNELSDLLQKFSDVEANIFVDRLTGFNHYGMSLNQLAGRYKLPLMDVYLLLTGVIHRILSEVIHHRKSYPLIAFIISDLQKQSTLTKSADYTLELWKKGLTISEIASRRRLKESTIRDHLVEIAFYVDDFPIEQYIHNEKLQQIQQAMEKVNSYKLKDIKQLIDEDISYFQIRLVLAVQNKLVN